MSLNWNATKVKNWQKLQDDPNGKVCNEVIIYVTMSVEMGQITEKNYKEFYARCNIIERFQGARRQKKVDKHIVDVFITLDEIKQRIGLSTNVSTKPYKSFLKRISECLYRETLREADRMDKNE